jgi:hypothetical protein
MANSFPGSGLVYVDQLAVGRSSGTSLINSFLSDDLNTIQIRAESNTSGVVSYTGIAPAYLEYYRNTSTGVDLTIQTKIQAAGGGGAIVFSPNSPSADLTPVERMRITKGGSVGIGTTSPSTILNVASSAPTIRLNPTTQNNSTAIEFGVLNAGNNAYAKIDATNTINYDTNLRFFTNGAGSFTQVERLRIDYNGNIGIGTTSPTAKLHVNGTSQFDDTLNFATRGKMSWGGSPAKLILTSSGSYNLALGTDDFVDRMTIQASTGNVGINTTSPGTYKLNVNGTFYSAGSSLEYKTDIITLDTDTNKILELRPVTYQYKDEYKHLGKELKSGTQIGLIAEEVAEVFPELALLKQDEDGEIRVRNVDYEKLSILLLSEVQKLRKEVNELKAQ